jgi:hypothetical protein
MTMQRDEVFRSKFLRLPETNSETLNLSFARFCGLHPLNRQGRQSSCRRERIWGPRFRREPLVVVPPWLATEIARSLNNPEFCRIRQNAHVIRRGYPARRSASF